MPKQKEENQEVQLPPEPIGPHSKRFREVLVRVKASNGFTDGTLKEHFEKYGYSVEWLKNEVREIPNWLYNRCVQSGGEFELVDG